MLKVVRRMSLTMGLRKTAMKNSTQQDALYFFCLFFLYSHPPKQTVASEINADPPAIRLGEDTPLNCFSLHQKNRR